MQQPSRIIVRLYLAAFLAFLPTAVSAQGTVMPVPRQVFLNNSGNPCASCLVYTYDAGTTTARFVYSDVALANSLPNPFTLNSAGRPQTNLGVETNVYLSATSYKFELRTSAGVVIWTADNVTQVPLTSGNIDITGTAGEALSAGDVVYLSDGSGALNAGQWYKADSDNTYSSSTAGMVGIAPSAIASAASGTIRLAGRVTGLSGLTAGELYYASATAGALTGTPPTNARFIGEAESTTVLILQGNPGGVRLPDSDGTHTLTVKTTSNLTADRLFTVVPGDADRTLTMSGDASLNQNVLTTSSPTFVGLTLSGAVATATTVTQSGDHIFTANSVIRRNTSDAADNGTLFVAGGGTNDVSRGSYIEVAGNEASSTGRIFMDLGNVANATLRARGGGATTILDVLGDASSFSAIGIYNNTDAGAANVVVLSDGTVQRNVSSARYKDLYGPLPDWHWFLRLTPQMFSAKGNSTGRRYGGFTAEDVARFSPRGPDGQPLFAGLDADGRPEDVAYPYLTSVAQQGLSDHEDRLNKQLDLIAGIEARLKALEAENAELRTRLATRP